MKIAFFKSFLYYLHIKLHNEKDDEELNDSDDEDADLAYDDSDVYR